MKRILFVLFALFFTLAAQAQMEVSEFYLAETDLAAREEKDVDGELYSIIKIRTESSNLNLNEIDAEAWSQLKGKTVKKERNNRVVEIWVYVRYGETGLKLFYRNSIKEIKFNNLQPGTKIGKGEVYIMNLRSVNDTELKQTEPEQYVVFTVEPPDATVIMDNSIIKDPNRNGGTLTTSVKVGKYQYSVSHDSYHEKRGTVTVTADQTAVVEVRLEPKFGSLDINSNPPRARIEIDGQSVGDTPQIIRSMIVGEHKVKLTYDGYSEYEGTVSVAEGKTTKVFEALREVQGTKDENADLLFTVGGVSFVMKKVEGGTFTMGCTSDQGGDCLDREEPAHKVTLSDYFIGETKVTQELWKAVMGSNPSECKGDNLPVENVSWNDCQEFIRKLNQKTGQMFSLPTEAQWEYAARGGNKSSNYKYAGDSNLNSMAWYGDNDGEMTHVVNAEQPNELGLHDMIGNIYEWCEDVYGSYSSDSQTNPRGPSSGFYRVYRGEGDRVSCRSGLSSYISFSILGFRLALAQ